MTDLSQIRAALAKASEGSVKHSVVGMKGFDEVTTYRLMWPSGWLDRLRGFKHRACYVTPADLATLKAEFPTKFKKEQSNEQ
jgi:hypothetical protein